MTTESAAWCRRRSRFPSATPPLSVAAAHLSASLPFSLKRTIIGWRQDEVGDWVAVLDCGHGQHVRHEPPLTFRQWVVSEEGRVSFLGYELDCKRCDKGEPATE